MEAILERRVPKNFRLDYTTIILLATVSTYENMSEAEIIKIALLNYCTDKKYLV